MKSGVKHWIAGEYDAGTGKISALYLVSTVAQDRFHCGQSINVSGKEYILGKRELDSGEVSSYELIPRSEVLEL